MFIDATTKYAIPKRCNTPIMRIFEKLAEPPTVFRQSPIKNNFNDR